MTRTVSELTSALRSRELRRFKAMRGERVTIKQRVLYHALADFEPKHNERGQTLCLNCGKTIVNKRKKKYCSPECLSEFHSKHNWEAMKTRILKKEKYVCQICGASPPRDKNGCLIWTDDHSSKDYFDYVVDHKTPIALGGNEFDESNLQVLCGLCNKVKTSEDLKKIIKKRRGMRLIRLENKFEVAGFPNIFQNPFISLDVFLRLT